MVCLEDGYAAFHDRNGQTLSVCGSSVPHSVSSELVIGPLGREGTRINTCASPLAERGSQDRRFAKNS